MITLERVLDPRNLTCFQEKENYYKLDLYYRIGSETLLDEFGDSLHDFLFNHCLITFRSDAGFARNVAAALDYLRDRGLDAIQCQLGRFDTMQVRELWRYQWNKYPLQRVALTEHLLNLGPTLTVLLRMRPDVSPLPATVYLEAIKGPSVPEERSGECLRTHLGSSSRIIKFIHTPDEPADLVRELGGLSTPSMRKAIVDAVNGEGVTSDSLDRSMREFYGYYPKQVPDINWAEALVLKIVSRTNRGSCSQASQGAEKCSWMNAHVSDVLARQKFLNFVAFQKGVAPLESLLENWALCLFGSEYVEPVLEGKQSLLHLKASKYWEAVKR